MTRNFSTFFSAFIGWAIALLLICPAGSIQAQELAFPGAEGFGKYATGGRGGQVLKVTNLNDSGTGSLREAIEEDFPRIIIFEVSGTIYLKSRLRIKNGDVTVAGQTAPGQGITLAHYNFYVEAENVIIRHIRSRLSAAANQEDDAFNCIGCTNVIVDHCSFSWSTDEVASLYHNKRLTLQNCIVAESFHNSIHEKGSHGYGGIWGGDSVSFHHNLIMHNTSRNPRMHGARWYSDWEEHVDFRNNVIYNWAGNSIYGGEPSEVDGSPVYINIVNNYYKYGPATGSSIEDRIMDPDADSQYGYGSYYIDGNYVYEYPETTADNWLGVDNVGSSVKEAIKSDSPFAYDITTIHTAEEAYAYVLENVGATIPYRDTIDRRMVYELENGVALCGGAYGDNTGIVDNLADVGGYPTLFSSPTLKDSDNDGMPDTWENSMSLDPNDPSDVHTIPDGESYPAIELYINSITASTHEFILPPTELTARLTAIKEISLSWTDNSSDETAFFVWRSNGGDYTIIDTLEANTTSYADTNITYDNTYNYKIQSLNATDTSAYSNVSSASTLGADGKPKAASNPYPTTGSYGVSTNATLSWSPGVGATSHKVYVGKSYPASNLVATTEDTVYTVTGLDPETRYYWRVNEVNENGATTGTNWNFTTRAAFPEELIAHFAFNSAIKLDDISGNGISATDYNVAVASFVDGVNKKGLDFDGSSQYISYGNNELVNFDINSFSISLWIKQDLNEINTTHSHRYIVKGSNDYSASKSHSGKRYEVYYTPDNSLFRFCVDDNEVKSEITAAESLFLTGDWVHVLAVRDTAAKKLYLYANAELVGETNDLTGDISQTEPLYISYCVDEEGYVDGIIDEVKLFGYALSPQQVSNLYTTGDVNTGVQENMLSSGFKVYPNPSTGTLNIQAPNEQTIQSVQINDITGRTLLYVPESALQGSSLTLDLRPYVKQNQQLLIVALTINNQLHYQKLILNE